MLIYLTYEAVGISFTMLPIVLLVLIALSEISDGLDGYLARKFNQITSLGKILDPVADTITHLTAFLSFTQPPINLPIWIVFIFLYRDTVVSTLRTLCALNGFALAARVSGKMKTVLQAATIVVILTALVLYSQEQMSLIVLQKVSMGTALITAIYTLYSCFDYFYTNRHHIARHLDTQANEVKNPLED